MGINMTSFMGLVIRSATKVGRLESTCPPGIDKSLALERKIESRKRNFPLDLEK